MSFPFCICIEIFLRQLIKPYKRLYRFYGIGEGYSIYRWYRLKVISCIGVIIHIRSRKKAEKSWAHYLKRIDEMQAQSSFEPFSENI